MLEISHLARCNSDLLSSLGWTGEAPSLRLTLAEALSPRDDLVILLALLPRNALKRLDLIRNEMALVFLSVPCIAT